MKIKTAILTASIAFGASFSSAGEPVVDSSKAMTLQPPPVASPFERALRPVTSPTLFDLPLPRTQANLVFIHQNHPDRLRTIIGDVPVGGDFQVYALQLELALSERFSLVAAKDGYIDFNPDTTLSKTDGWANLAAGVKYAFLYNPEDALAAALNLQVEVPTGNSDVWQGEGDGAVIPSVSAVKLWNGFQFAGNLGARIPFDNNGDSTTMHANAHISYELTDRFSPLVELNYFRVLDEGAGQNRFPAQAGGAVPSIVTFEGGDLINLGTANASDKDLVTLALGFRYRITDKIDIGAAYEIPLTDEEASLMESRITVSAVVRF